MESEVQMVPIGELCDFLSGFAFKSEDLKGNSGIPVVKIKNVNNKVVTLEDMQFYPEDKLDSKVSRFLLSDGDVLIAMTGQGSVGRVGRLSKPKETKLLLNQRVGKFIPKRTVACLDYIYYVISSEKYENILFNAASGSGQPNLSPAIIKAIQIPFIPLKDQIVVSQILTKLDKKITLNRQINHTLEQMAQALFKSWFVDFDPVVDNALDASFFEQDLEFSDELLRRAEARKAVRENADFKPLPEDVRQLFPAAFEECSEPSLGLGGWVPEGWESLPVGSLIDLIGGGTPKTSEHSYWGGDIPWFSVVDAPNDSDVFVLSTEKKITDLGVKNSSTKVLRIGTTIISARGTVGKCALVATPMAMNQSCYGVIGTNGIHDYFIYYLIRQSVSQLQQRSHGSVFSTITRDTFNSFKFAFSGELIANTFGETISPWFEKIRANNQQRYMLQSLRDILLPKLISGELRLSDSEVDTADEVLA